MNKISNVPISFDELSKKLNEASCKQMIILFGSCVAIFDGRIKSYLPLGERLLIVKKDESLILHGSSLVKPLNWQKAGAGKIEYLFNENQLIVKTYRPKTKESLEIIFDKVFQATIFNALDSASLSIYGSESDLSNYLFNHPEIISKEFQPTTREYETPFGFIDIRGVDKKGNIIIIEVKKRAATPADAHQLKRYVDYFSDVEKIKVKGILVAKDFSNKVMAILETNELEAVAVNWLEIFPALANEKPAVTMDDFIENSENKVD
jgi:RecB family endonuclease NucS